MLLKPSRETSALTPMIQIKIDSSVLAALKKAMPKTDKAERALGKYVATLETMMDKSLLRANDNNYRFFKRFQLSLHELMRATGEVRIGGRRTYLHKWLDDNNLALVNVVKTGLKGDTFSVVNLTSIATATDAVQATALAKMSVQSLEAFLNDKTVADQAYFDRFFPKFRSLSKREVRKQYDWCEIDVGSLKEYVFRLVHKSDELNAVERDRTLKQAETILRIAQFTNGRLPQRKNNNFFGRNYYYGLSVQSARKSLREAMLGDCYEYDLRSSVISWKLGFAEMLLKHEGSREKLSDAFGATQAYLDDKQIYVNDVREQTFGADIAGDAELKNSLIKEALTAMSFGARMHTQGWIDASGNVMSPALVTIIKDARACKLFVASDFVKLFWAEQKRLDRFIFRHFTTVDKSLASSIRLQTESGLVSKSKVLAYLYQHAETFVMDIVRKELKIRKHAVVANVHDGIYVRRRIARKIKAEIERRMRGTTGIRYWAFKEERLRACVGVSAQLKREKLAFRSSPQTSLSNMISDSV